MSQHERPDGPGHIPHTERRESRDDGDLRIALREEDVGEHQGGGLRVNEEVVVLERAANPAAGRGLLRLLRELGGLVRARWFDDLVLHASSLTARPWRASPPVPW